MFIKNSFQTTALIWIPSLGKKPDLQSGKNRFAMEKAIQTECWTLDIRGLVDECEKKEILNL